MKRLGRKLFVAAAFLLSGCAGVSTYHDTPHKNLHVRTTLKDNGSRIRADLDIYARVDRCHDKYLGSVKLDKPVVDIGLPTDKELHLTYVITRNSLFGGHRGLEVSSSLTPRAGHEYHADVKWVSGMYDVKMFDSRPHSRARHRIRLHPAPSC